MLASSMLATGSVVGSGEHEEADDGQGDGGKTKDSRLRLRLSELSHGQRASAARAIVLPECFVANVFAAPGALPADFLNGGVGV